MPAANFMKRFAEPVRTGKKTVTIREGNRWKVGDRFAGFTGMRSTNCERLVESVVTHADPIELNGYRVTVCGRELLTDEIHALACADGFDGALSFFAFHTGGTRKKTGQLIRWK
jgi:uncharacterized protein YqfB (UPF0267 family)